MSRFAWARSFDWRRRRCCATNHRRGVRRFWLIPVLLSVAACAPLARYDTAGELAGQRVETRVDSPAAAYYLTSYLPGRHDDAALSERITATLREIDPAPQNRAGLEALTQAQSTDLATIHFIARVYQDAANRRLQDRYHEYLERLTNAPQESIGAADEDFTGYKLVFVPGYAYRNNPTNGADFRRQRELLTRLGFDPILLATEELGTVEVNAAIVAAELAKLAVRDERLIVISASKGGPEVAMALSALQDDPALERIKAWISVGGLLRGSPYADRFLSGIKRWVARFVLKRRGQPPDIMDNLSTVVRRPAFDELSLPSGLLVMHYVAAPLSGHVAEATRGRYRVLRRQGPNDGLTLLADELTASGLVVTAVGLDHYFRAPDIDLRTVALTYAVLDELRQRELARSQVLTSLRAEHAIGVE